MSTKIGLIQHIYYVIFCAGRVVSEFIASVYANQVNQISIDNWTFKLFYKATTTILLACSLLSGTKQFFGEPINCDVVRHDQ